MRDSLILSQTSPPLLTPSLEIPRFKQEHFLHQHFIVFIGPHHRLLSTANTNNCYEIRQRYFIFLHLPLMSSIVSRCLETPVKHDARVFDMASKTIHTSLAVRGYCFSALISHEIMSLTINQNAGNLLLFVINHVGDSGVFCSEYRKPFFDSKNLGRRIKAAEREYS